MTIMNKNKSNIKKRECRFGHSRCRSLLAVVVQILQAELFIAFKLSNERRFVACRRLDDVIDLVRTIADKCQASNQMLKSLFHRFLPPVFQNW